MSDFTVQPPTFVYTPFRPKLSDPLRSQPTQFTPPDVKDLTVDYYRGLEEQMNSRKKSSLVGRIEPGKQLGSFALIKYISLGIMAPFEVGATLVQLQWLPNDVTYYKLQRQQQQQLKSSSKESDYTEEETELSDDYLTEDSIDSGDPEYYDPRRKARRPKKAPKPPLSPEPVVTDSIGYLDVQNPYDDSIRPSYQFYPVQGGAFTMIKTIWNHEDEGFFSLWKGQATHWIREMIHICIQPTIEGYFNDLFGLYDDTIPLHHLDRAFPNFATMAGSHLLTGWLLSPLDMIRTRMIAQTNHKQHRRYSNPIQALVDIVSSEHHGSLWSLYFSPQLFFPTLIVYTVKPILHHASPLIIDRCFGQAVSESPLKSALAHFAILTVGLIILRPVETIRKRLQIQVMGGARELETCVVVGRQYRGFWDCFYRILTEEGGQRQKRPRRSGKHDKSSQEVEEVSWWNSWGISGLYRGFWADTGLNALQCLAHLSSNLPDELEEW